MHLVNLVLHRLFQVFFRDRHTQVLKTLNVLDDSFIGELLLFRSATRQDLLELLYLHQAFFDGWIMRVILEDHHDDLQLLPVLVADLNISVLFGLDVLLLWDGGVCWGRATRGNFLFICHQFLALKDLQVLERLLDQLDGFFLQWLFFAQLHQLLQLLH